MSIETFRAALLYAENHGEIISLGGGEPTIHPLFWDMLGLAVLAETESETVWLATNGKNTKIALRLARLARQGKISCDLSQDEWHDPIEPKVVAAFTRDEKERYSPANNHDFRGIRRARPEKIINAGRAKKNGIGIDKGCICDELFITPDGHIHPCGCSAGLKMDFGTVDKTNIDPHYISGNCAKNKNKWKEENG